MSTLTNGTAVTLSDSLEWIDEFDFTPVVQRTGRTVTGALFVEEVALAAGRPITLQTVESGILITRAVLETLLAWAQTPNTTMVLNLRAVDYTVIFDRSAGKPIEVRAWWPGLGDVDPGDFYSLTLRLLQVA